MCHVFAPVDPFCPCVECVFVALCLCVPCVSLDMHPVYPWMRVTRCRVHPVHYRWTQVRELASGGTPGRQARGAVLDLLQEKGVVKNPLTGVRFADCVQRAFQRLARSVDGTSAATLSATLVPLAIFLLYELVRRVPRTFSLWVCKPFPCVRADAF